MYQMGSVFSRAGGRGSWTGDNCEEIPCSTSDGNDYTCCECHTFGHFGLLLVSIYIIEHSNFTAISGL